MLIKLGKPKKIKTVNKKLNNNREKFLAKRNFYSYKLLKFLITERNNMKKYLTGMLLICSAFVNIYAVRPIETEDPPIVGKNVFSIESGISYDNSNASYDLTFLYGITKRLEVAVLAGYLQDTSSFNSGTHIKYELPFVTFKSEYIKKLNSQNSEFSFLLTKYVYNSEKVSVFGSVGYSFNKLDNDSFFYSAASMFKSGRATLYLDIYFAVDKDDIGVFNKHNLSPMIGFGYSVSDKLTLDCAYQLEMVKFRKETDVYIAGLTLSL